MQEDDEVIGFTRPAQGSALSRFKTSAPTNIKANRVLDYSYGKPEGPDISQITNDNSFSNIQDAKEVRLKKYAM